MAGFFRSAAASMQGARDMMDYQEQRADRSAQRRRFDERDQWEREDRAHTLARRPADEAHEDWRRTAERSRFANEQQGQEMQRAAVTAARAVMAGDFSLAKRMYDEQFPDGNSVDIKENQDGSIDLAFSNGVRAKARDRQEFLFGREDGTGMGFIGLFDPKQIEAARNRRVSLSDEKRSWAREDQRDSRRFGQSVALQDRAERLASERSLSDPRAWIQGDDGMLYRPTPNGMEPVLEAAPAGGGPRAPFRPAAGGMGGGRFGSGRQTQLQWEVGIHLRAIDTDPVLAKLPPEHKELLALTRAEMRGAPNPQQAALTARQTAARIAASGIGQFKDDTDRQLTEQRIFDSIMAGLTFDPYSAAGTGMPGAGIRPGAGPVGAPGSAPVGASPSPSLSDDDIDALLDGKYHGNLR